MPETTILFYCDEDGSAPVLEWLIKLARRQPQASEKCRVRIETLRQLGYELRRPIADYLDQGIYELRTRHGTVQYRILYFFYGQNIAVLAHGLTKKKEVPRADILVAIQRKERFERDPAKYTYREQEELNGHNG